MNQISEVTRRDIIDGLLLDGVNWSGRLDEIEFLSQIFDIESLPSDDPRFRNMAEDIWQHCINNPNDWSIDWVYDDPRLDLLGCKDELFLKFLTEMVHPTVRPDSVESRQLANSFNQLLRLDGFELYESKQISRRPVFAARRVTIVDSTVQPVTIIERDINRIWAKGCFRLFISHSSVYKAEVSNLKSRLEQYNISSFVAHEDIEPTREWQIEIENALRTMDALLVYLTPNFHESNWTDQEIGFAVCRDVMIIPVRMGIDPYGFIGKTQGISGHKLDTGVLASKVYELILSNERYCKRINSSIIERFERTGSFQEAKDNWVLLNQIKVMTSDEIDRVERAYKTNSQLRDSFFIQGRISGFIDSKRKEL